MEKIYTSCTLSRKPKQLGQQLRRVQDAVANPSKVKANKLEHHSPHAHKVEHRNCSSIHPESMFQLSGVNLQFSVID